MSYKILPAFFDRPERIRIAYQEDDEILELFLRHHFVTNIPWMVAAVILVFMPILWPFLRPVFGTIIPQFPTDVKFSLGIIWYLLVLAFIIERMVHWYFNIYIITSKRLIDVDFINLMYRNITEVSLGDVQSARSKISGIVGSLFNFGDVTIESAAKGQVIDFLDIPRPDFVADRIQDLQREIGEDNVN